MSEHHTPTVALYTLGCRLNQCETEAIREQFIARGYNVVPFSEQADVYVVNTCTVTAHADYRGRQALRRAIRTAPEAKVVATGCYAQTSAEKLLGIEGVDLVLGNAEKGDLVDYVEQALKPDTPAAYVTRRAEIRTFDDRMDVHSFEGRTRATLKIQDGCDQFCTFCIIPWARGRHRSRPYDQVIQQTRELIDNGYREVVLTGVHMGEYGSDLSPATTLTDTVRALLSIRTLPRLRLSSIWPTGVTDEMIEMMADEWPRFCRYVHVAIQHGHDEILDRMKRTYNTRTAGRVLEKLHNRVPDICMGSDIMVGFPGETDEHFEDMYRWLEEMPLTYLHVFSYSRRPHTRAASMPDQVPPEVIQERSQKLRALSTRKTGAFNRSFVGKEVDILVESRDDTGRLNGLTDNYLRVHIPGDDVLINTVKRVRIDEAGESGALGIPLDGVGGRLPALEAIGKEN